jgi:hypothetical protein
MMHVNLIIATPGNSVLSGYLRSLLGAVKELDSRGITWAFSQEYASHVANAREMSLNGGNQNLLDDSRPFKGQVTYDKILWIDSDIQFTPEDVIRAYESDKDIVTGAYLEATGRVVAFKLEDYEMFSLDEVKALDVPVEIHSAGMGFMAVKQGVFESLSRPWFQSVDDTFTQGGKEFTFPITGEDISFCKRSRDNGYTIWLDPEIKLIHHKTYKLTWEGLALA